MLDGRGVRRAERINIGRNKMHFFYLDETGDTGNDFDNFQQPIFVLGGISVRDKSWLTTQGKYQKIISDYFNKRMPGNFEIHCNELLSPNGEGPFEGHPIDKRLSLVDDIITLLETQKHDVHYIAFLKSEYKKFIDTDSGIFIQTAPYLVAYDYLITYMNWHVKNNLGKSARGMVIFDKKEQYHEFIDRINNNRRYVDKDKIKWIVEFSYAVDSKRNPMIQISDVVILIIRRFFEIDSGLRSTWPDHVKGIYTNLFGRLYERIQRKSIIEREGRSFKCYNEALCALQLKPSRGYQTKYPIEEFV